MSSKFILLTGSDGNLGGKLTKFLADFTDYSVVAVSSFPERIPLMIEREKIQHTDKIIQMSSDEMFRSDLTGMNICGAVHFAFSRAIFPNKDIASSLDYSLAAFNKIIDSNIQNAIYVSSQSVYGNIPEWRSEETIVSPESIYAMAKYAGEKLFESCYRGHDDLQHAIIRLDIIAQSQNLVKALCKNAKEKGAIHLTGGKQQFSYLDIRDVPGAIYALLSTKSKWKPVYNVGWNKKRYSLIDIANKVKDIALNDGISVTISLDKNDTELWSGMDSSLFLSDTNWKPTFEFQQIIKNIYDTINTENIRL